MSEKTRSISISSNGGGVVVAPAVGVNIISGPISSSPSSVMGGYSSGGNANNNNNNNINNNINNNNINNNINNDSESELNGVGGSSGGGYDLNTSIGLGIGNGGDNNSIMNSSQISTASNDSVSIAKTNINFTHNIVGSSCRFPKLEECAHFHYERVQLGSLSVRLADEKSDLLNSSVASQSIGGDVASTSSIIGTGGGNQHNNNTSRLGFYPQTYWFIIKVSPSRSDPFLIKRSFENVRMLDEMLHRCVYDRKISGLKDLSQCDNDFKSEEDIEYAVAKYLERFSKIASDSLTCGTILTWFQLDNKGRRLPLADTETMKSINTPAVGAAYGVRRYVAQACDEISIEVGDMISVIDMPSPAESIWWRGKKSHLQKSHYEVGFFPQSCVATIGDKVPRHFPLPAPLVGQLDVSPTKPVLRKHGKLIAFFRSFILSRPSRRRLKQTGIYRERVFSCDLSEHLLNSGQEIPMVLKCCAEFLEENGIVDGIYRLSGITSNIQKLRRAFDEERIPDLCHPEIKQDIHAVSSLLKMYFRELPNPLCTYQLYDNFVEAIQAKSDANERLRLMKETVLKLPPPHYRTLKYLATHLSKISRHSANTGMTDKNLAIVWAPNLLRSPALESGGVAALRGVGVQAVVTEYLIKNCNLIFDPSEDYRVHDQRMDSLTDCESLLIEQREHDASLTLIERPKSLSAGGAKLISLEEAQERHSRAENFDLNKSIPINAPPPNVGSYIEVGGGPSSLPDKYHTVLPVPRSWQKRKTHSWKSLFSRNPRSSNSNHDVKTLSVSSPVPKEVEPSIPYSGSEANVIDKTHNNSTQGVQLQQKPKSIDLFDGKPMEICVRSNSIDSLRTAGHSRSVSHDSYFDLLQSPLRGIATCPSRELSELGLNFDREEPEMRIFSESESLVSSPKVGKENIPPSRRVLRARPEEFSSTTNSVNPSPKKQPRLNLLSPTDNVGTWNSVSVEDNRHDENCCKRYKLEDQLSDIQFIDCSTPEHTIQNPNTIVYASVQVHNPPSSLSSKGSSFSDDVDKVKKCTSTGFEAIFENKAESSDNTHTRYSYPVTYLTGKRKENDAALKERFSYPGSGNNGGKYVCRMPPSNIKMNIEEEKDIQRRSFSQKLDNTKSKNRYSYCDPTSTSGDINPKISFSILRSNSADLLNKQQHSQKQQSHNQLQDIARSKLSVMTPSSPIQSPHYSLLVGETSSENSSVVNTPIFEMDITSSHDPDLGGGGNTDDELGGEGGNRGMRRRNNTKDFSYIVSEDSCSNLTSQLSHNTTTTTTTTTNNDYKRDISALKRELSLDLEGGVGGSKMSIDLTDLSLTSSINNKQNEQNQNQHQQLINFPLSPNTNSNFTTHNTSDLDTSQSITPSEFGYQHLNRQSNVVSLENSPNFDGYENLDNAFINYDNNISHQNHLTKKSSSSSVVASPPPSSSSTTITTAASSSIISQQQSPIKQTKVLSPIKATINITYNLKSPVQKKISNNSGSIMEKSSPSADYETVSIIGSNGGVEKSHQHQYQKQPKKLLETSFDENMVYEQVKFFRSSVSEVNNLLNNGNNDEYNLDNVAENEQQQIVPELETVGNKEVNSNLIVLDDDTISSQKKIENYQNENSDDILMTDNINSLELEQNYSLYENVELRKPPIHYENVEINSKDSNSTALVKDLIEKQKSIDNDYHNSVTLTSQNSSSPPEKQQKRFSDSKIITKSTTSITSNFSVKQLATKFETSPIEQMPPFDFSIGGNNRGSKKFNDSTSTNRDAPCYIRAKNHNKQLNKASQQITRSLDENAFIREFGNKRFEDVTKSVQQIEKLDESRRKSFDFMTRPKNLNPPKKLPNIQDSDELCSGKSINSVTTEKSLLKLKLDATKSQSSSKNDIKITPTTENRISLIQNNVIDQGDERNSLPNLSSITATGTSPNMKVLSGVKLNRERIEQIKEERRHQLNEKYRPESFRSKSKTELREIPKEERYQSESLRVKSKSRGDIRNLQHHENSQQLQQYRNSTTDKGTDVMQFANTRVRRISDEKNQNNFEPILFNSETGGNEVHDSNVNNSITNNTKAVQKFERKSLDFVTSRERDATDIIRGGIAGNNIRNSISSTREKISPQFSIRDVTAMFESRSQNQ